MSTVWESLSQYCADYIYSQPNIRTPRKIECCFSAETHLRLSLSYLTEISWCSFCHIEWTSIRFTEDSKRIIYEKALPAWTERDRAHSPWKEAFVSPLPSISFPPPHSTIGKQAEKHYSATNMCYLHVKGRKTEKAEITAEMAELRAMKNFFQAFRTNQGTSNICLTGFQGSMLCLLFYSLLNIYFFSGLPMHIPPLYIAWMRVK